MQKLLILSSNPRQDLKLDREISDLNNAVQRFSDLKVSLGLGVRAQELAELLAEHSPQLVHFCGHGAGQQGLVMQDETGKEQLVSTSALARIFQTFSGDINCTVLNACNSSCQAEVIVEHIDYVVGMSQPILDRAAHLFSVAFYKGLAARKTIEQSYAMGCIAIQIWWESGAKDTQSRQYRELQQIGEISTPNSPILPEHEKPVLLKKSVQFPSPAALPQQARVQQAGIRQSSVQQASVQQASVQVDPIDDSAEFVEFVRQVSEIKAYKDNVRDAYDSFGQYSAQHAGTLKKSKHRQRQIFLSKVRQFWIEGFLNLSLKGFKAVQLGWNRHSGAISPSSTQSIESLCVELDDSFEQLRQTKTYQEIGQGRTLLILGAPGSGKTIALLQLAKRLVERSEENLDLPMPVVLNLSSWAKHRKPITEWLLDELSEMYHVPKVLGKRWIAHQQLILLLDGLDEVHQDYRNDCVRALNEFIKLSPQTEIAVCSRVKDYEALTERLQISSALCLQPFSATQISQFLENANSSLAGLKALLERNPEIQAFAQTPLILYLMSVAYEGWSFERLSSELGTASGRYHHLFETYFSSRLGRDGEADYSSREVLRSLHCLASQMVEEKQTIFLIERMQTSWLRTKGERMAYRIFCWPVSIVNGSLREIVRQEIQPLEKLSWSWKRFGSRFIRASIRGFVSGFVFWLLLGVVVGGGVGLLDTMDGSNLDADVVNGAGEGLLYGVGIGFIAAFLNGITLGMLSGLDSADIERRTTPNQGIKSSWKYCRWIGWSVSMFYLLVAYVLFGFFPEDPLFGDPFSVSILFDILVLPPILLKYGGGSVLQHFVLRIILKYKHRVHWNYAKFLDFTADRLILKKVGGGYMFFHRMLLEHLASTQRSN